MGDVPWSHCHLRKKQIELLLQNSQSPFVHSAVSLAPTSPLHSLHWCVLKQILKDWRTFNLAAQPPQWQLENYFKNLQLGHFTLIG